MHPYGSPARTAYLKRGGIPTCQYVSIEDPETRFRLITIGAGIRKFVTEVARLPDHCHHPQSI